MTTDPFGEYRAAAVAAIGSAETSAALEAVRVEFLGKKRGRLRELQALLGQAPPEQRPELGQRFNAVRVEVEQVLADRQAALASPTAVLDALDVTLPGTPPVIGRRHPLSRTIDEFIDIVGRFGFTVADGPELEDEYHNFEALNIPPEHPARDPLENFYLAAAEVSGGPVLLRSQTSTVQIRVMESTPPPVRIVSLGRCYRPDTIDATHHCMFHQMEGLMVDEGVTLAELKTVLKLFAAAFLGGDVPVRFRPSFFPFTEPSVEVDVFWQDRWLELGGAGMVDPNVLSAVGYDPERVTGFAFGLGIERFCIIKHRVSDIRRFLENDLRFLSQF